LVKVEVEIVLFQPGETENEVDVLQRGYIRGEAFRREVSELDDRSDPAAVRDFNTPSLDPGGLEAQVLDNPLLM
jgi:hypothetical protein